jgi:hypothetical protein
MKRFTMIVFVLLTLVLQTSYAQEFNGINHVNRLYSQWMPNYGGSSTGDTLYIASGDNLRGRVVVTMFDCSDSEDIHVFNSFPLDGLVFLTLNSHDNLVFIGHSTGMRIFGLNGDGCYFVSGDFNLDAGITAIELSGQYAFLGSDDGQFIVVDISDPQQPRAIATSNLDYTPTQIKVSGSFAYVTGDRFSIINLEEPDNPEIVSTTNRSGLDLEIIGDVACIAIGDEGIRFYDVSDPTDPFETGHIRNRSNHIEQLDGRLFTGHHIYEWEGGSTGVCSMIDVSNPFVPEVVTGLSGCTGDLFCVVGGLIAQFNTGQWAESGITFHSISENNRFNEQDLRVWPKDINFVLGNGQFLYATNGNNDDQDLVVLNASNPERPIEVSRLNLGRIYRNQLCYGNERIYFQETGGHVTRSVDVSNPLEPYITDFRFEPRWRLGFSSFRTHGNHLIIPTTADGRSGIFMVSTDPDNPEETFSQLFGEVHMPPAIVDNYMYAPARSDGVIIFDISDIMHPREVGRFEVENDAWYLDAEGDLLCVSDGNLNVFNIENRENPELLSVYDVPDSTRDIQIEYDYVYVHLGNRAYWHLPLLHIVDLTDPSNPVSVGHGETYYRPTNFFLNPPYIYTSDINGLGIYECSEVVGVSPDKEGFSPQTTMLYPAYPNPFNGFTSLQYNLTKPATVQIGIFDTHGRQVLDVANHQLRYPGIHTEIVNANSLPSGSYYAFLKAGDLHEVAPLILVK